MKKIKKSAEVATEDGTHQLTGIEVHEVSVVDRAANMRRFITRKADETPAETAARIQSKIEARGDKSPGAELDAAAALVSSVVAEKAKDAADVADGGDLSTVHAHAASAHAAAATAHAAAAEDAGKKTKKAVAPLPPPAGAGAVAPVAASTDVSDPEAELLALAKAGGVETFATSKATDITVATNPDGSVAITVDENAPVILNPSLPASVADKVKASVVAGIDAIMLRIATLRQNVLDSKGSYSASGTPQELYDIWYIRDMLCALYDIGGPCWEIEQAGDVAAAAIADVMKAAGVPVRKNKLISQARVMKLKMAHEAMRYAHSDMEKVFKELDTEGGDATGEMASQTAASNGSPTPSAPSNFAKAATVAPAKDIKEDPAFIALAAELERSKAELTKSQKGAEALQKIVANQGDIIAKARGSVAPSNVSGESSPAPVVVEVEWPRDLAAPTVALSKNFGRDDQRPRR